jgi:hypothetical protein
MHILGSLFLFLTASPLKLLTLWSSIPSTIWLSARHLAVYA